MRLTGKTQLYGIIGYPVKHSLSPLFQNLFFQSCNVDAVYVPFEVSPENLKDAIRGLKALKVKGVNVTIPHKEAVLELVDHIDEHAKVIGAVNTLKFAENEIHAFNTDWIGFKRALLELIPNQTDKNPKALVLGAGGSSRAVLYALKELNYQVYIYNRTKERALKLSQELKTQVVDRPEDVIDKVKLIVNTTSVGLNPTDPPIFDYDRISTNHIIVDIIYRETPLIKKAKQLGCKYQTGLEMLIYQGVESFKIWTGIEVPQELIDQAKREVTLASSL